MAKSSYLDAMAVARLAVTAGFELVPVNSRWQSEEWRLAWVCPAGALPQAASQPFGSQTNAHVHNDTVVEIHRDEAEGYWLNVTATEPSIFVLWRAEDGAAPQALAATLSYHEAGRWMDGGQSVDRVPMPAEMTAWLTDFVNRTYEPPQPSGRSQTLERLLAQGRGGVMAGRGFFDWGDRPAEELFRDRDRRLLALKRALREIGPLKGDDA